MDDELRFHIETYAEDLMRGGVPREEALRRARLEFGGAERVKEECREARGVVFLESLLQDLRFGLRTLRKSPGFTAVAVLTLTLGIGATTAIFSVVDAVLVRALPFHDPNRLVAIFQSPDKSKGLMGSAASGPDILDWRRDSHSFADVVASLSDEANLTWAGSPQHENGEMVTANYFDLLGVQAAMGRTFVRGEDEPGQNHEVIVSYALWQRSFGSQNILGRTIELDDQPFTVVGVMPVTFHDPRTWMNPESDYWIPLPHSQLEANRGKHMYAVLGRLAPKVTLALAQQEMDVIADREGKQFPNTNEGWEVRVSSLQEVSLQTFEEGHFQSVRPSILLLQLSAGFLLLIACANVANLMLSRLVSRHRELALRSAMGAGRRRLARQLLTESILLSVLAGAAGILLAVWCKNVLLGLAPKGYLPPTASVSLDLEVLGFTLVVSTLTGIIFGFFPAVRAARQNLNEELKGAATGTAHSSSMPRVRRALVIFELATTFVLLVGGGLMVRSLASLLAVNPGFNPRDFFAAGLSLPNQRHSKPEQIVQFFSAVQERIVKLPGIDAAAFTSAPEFDVTTAASIAVDGQSSQATGLATVWPQICIITSGFFRAAGIPILEGRDFSPAAILSGEKTAIVSQAFANYFWPRQSPLGKRLRYGQQGWREVLGVVGDVRQEGLAAPSLPEVYLPMTQDIADGETAMNIVVRSSVPTALLAREVEQQVWAVDSGIPVSRVRSGSQLLGQWAGYLRYRTVLLGSFAVIGLLIAVIGVFGAISYTTAQRTHEMGIRMALGAQRRDMFRLIALQGAKLVVIGLTMGIVGALILTRLMTSLLYGVTPSDPFTFVSVAVLLMLVALVACYIPARQAMRVDPMIALRYE